MPSMNTEYATAEGEVGKLLLYRVGADDLDPEGTRIRDSQRFAEKLEKAGVDIIDVSGYMWQST